MPSQSMTILKKLFCLQPGLVDTGFSVATLTETTTFQPLALDADLRSEAVLPQIDLDASLSHAQNFHSVASVCKHDQTTVALSPSLKD